MKIHDLFAMAVSNLKQRKSRTLLTSIGVMIGCTSIVVMVSIGFGLSESMTTMLEGMGDLRTIQIYGKTDGKQMKPGDEKNFLMVPNVSSSLSKTAFPNEWMTGVSASNDRYKTDWSMMAAVDASKIKEYGYEITDGSDSLISTNSTIPILVGENFAYNFRDTMRPLESGYVDRWVFDENGMPSEEKTEPFFDPFKQDLKLSIQNPEDLNASPYTVTLHPVGLMKEDYNIGQESSDGFVMSDTDLKKIIKEASEKFGIKKPDETVSQIRVKAQDIEAVEDVENAIKQQGYMTSSMRSIRDSMEDQSRMTQMILGGIGAISLIVAAIGITNTMIMSVSERTREIGIMKALGCKTGDIKKMFLSEAGMIGVIGGISGLILSYLISIGINYITYSMTPREESFFTFLFTPGNRASVIPLWLVVFALIFSAMVGVISGLIPANRSVKISALEAIRRE
ncbi:ABC transporter permease [Ileibacterium valens]|uniref:ABC transporter permease n=1 Tax=Ileibacterium valens TaxID=1862668 RepID=UPI00259BA2AB|nr:ABC transporter permease [Ileibacterium valens]